MDVIWMYGLFALTTAICAHYELIAPVMRELEVLAPEDDLVQSKWISHITMFLMSILFAPVVIVPALVPSAGNWFREALLVGLKG